MVRCLPAAHLWVLPCRRSARAKPDWCDKELLECIPTAPLPVLAPGAWYLPASDNQTRQKYGCIS